MEDWCLSIKNMVCDRCIQVVRADLEALGLRVTGIELGKVTLAAGSDPPDMARIEAVLVGRGFELLRDERKKLLERIKILVINLIHHQDPPRLVVNYSDYLAGQLGRDYQYISGLFSSLERTTLEKYIILQKIERAKELLSYDELPIGRVAQELGYSSLGHFSSQFKQLTDLTPSQYKGQYKKDRRALDKLGG